jgi:hypothetical protein
MNNLLSRPGFHTSEWFVAVATLAWYVLNAWQDYTSTNASVKLSAPAIAYVLSRGLAKYEGRNTPPPPGA